MASLSTHHPYVPGRWALDQVRLWQANRSAAFEKILDVMNRVGAEGAFCHDRVIGFWFETSDPPDKKAWKMVRPSSRRPGTKGLGFSSGVGPNSRLIWAPRKNVPVGKPPRATWNPLHDEVFQIEIPDWWNLAVSLGLRPVFWPNQGVMLLPELDVLGDFGEHVLIWVPRDRFGVSIPPIDCARATKDQIRLMYAEAFGELERVPVIEAYLGPDIAFKFNKDLRVLVDEESDEED